MRAYHVVDPGQIDIQDAFVQKEQGGQRLGLSGWCHMEIRGQMAQERPNFLATHEAWMAVAVKVNESANPVDISLAGTEAVMAELDFGSDGVEQAQGCGHWG